MINKKNDKRVSLSVLAASKSIRRSIKFCHKQFASNNQLLPKKSKMNPIIEQKHARLETMSASKLKETSNINAAQNTPSLNKITLKERIEMSSNRLAKNKNPILSIRERNQFNTPNSVKKTTTSNEYLAKRFNSAHVNLNENHRKIQQTNSTLFSTAQKKLFNTPKTNFQTPSTKSVRVLHMNSAAATYKTPQSKFTISNSNKNLFTGSKSVKTVSSRTVDRAKSSVRRSIQILNNVNLTKESNTSKTPTTNFRRNLFQNGSKIPLYTGSTKQYPKTEEKKSSKEENLTRTTVKARRSSRYSRLSDIESSCLILTPKLMRQILSKATNNDNDMKIVEEEDEEPIKVKTIKPSSLIKYLFSEKEKSFNIMNADKLKEENMIENVQSETILDINDQNIKKDDENSQLNIINQTENTIAVGETTIETINENSNTGDNITSFKCAVQDQSDESSLKNQTEDFEIVDINDIPMERTETKAKIDQNINKEIMGQESQESYQIEIKNDQNCLVINNDINITTQNNENQEIGVEPTEKNIEIHNQLKANEINETNQEISASNHTDSLIENKNENKQIEQVLDIEENKLTTEKEIEKIVEEKVQVEPIETNFSNNLKKDDFVITNISISETQKMEGSNQGIDEPSNKKEVEIGETVEKLMENENLLSLKLKDKLIDSSPLTPTAKKRKYTKKAPINLITETETKLEGLQKENIPELPLDNIEEYSISKTIEIQTDFEPLELTSNITNTNLNNQDQEISTSKSTRKKREKKTAVQQQPFEEIANEGRMLTRAQRAKLNQK